MLCGIDSGTTLAKAAWRHVTDEYHCIVGTRDSVTRQLVAVCFTKANIIGIGTQEFEGLTLVRKPGDPIDTELRIQADGARRLLAQSSASSSPENFFLASIGTGTSYMVVRPRSIEKIEFGRGLGGGTIMGLARTFFNVDEFSALESLALGARFVEPSMFDIMVNDLVPASEIDPSDPNAIVSNLGKLGRNTPVATKAAAIFHLVAANIAQDAAMLLAPRVSRPDVLYVGMPVGASQVLRQYLDLYSRKYGLTPHFLPDKYAAYAGAVGAFHMND